MSIGSGRSGRSFHSPWLSRVPSQNLKPDILMMQPAKGWELPRLAFCYPRRMPQTWDYVAEKGGFELPRPFSVR